MEEKSKDVCVKCGGPFGLTRRHTVYCSLQCYNDHVAARNKDGLRWMPLRLWRFLVANKPPGHAVAIGE